MMQRTKLPRAALLVLGLALVATMVSAQERTVHRGFGPDAEFRYEFLSGGDVVTVPFELVNNHLILEVSVNGSEPFRTILDTGMPMSGMFLYDTERVKALNLPYGDAQVQVGGVGGDGKPKMAKLSSGVTVSIGDLEIEDRRVIVTAPVSHFPDYHAGIIGAALFTNFVVHIDYDEMVVKIYKPGSFQAPEGAATLPITLQHNIPYTEATVTTAAGTKVPLRLVLDLGASHAVSLNSKAHEALVPPKGALQTVIGKGLTGLVTGYVGRVQSFELAGQTLSNVLATFPDSEFQSPRGIDMRDGNLGSGILKRFNVTFDYANKQVLLEPNKSFSDPFRYDMSGIRLREDRERTFWIEELLPDSPASEAGLQIDDILTDVNGKTVAELGLQEIKKLLKREGKKITLGFRRGSERIEVKLKLRQLV